MCSSQQTWQNSASEIIKQYLVNDQNATYFEHKYPIIGKGIQQLYEIDEGNVIQAESPDVHHCRAKLWLIMTLWFTDQQEANVCFIVCDALLWIMELVCLDLDLTSEKHSDIKMSFKQAVLHSSKSNASHTYVLSLYGLQHVGRSTPSSIGFF